MMPDTVNYYRVAKMSAKKIAESSSEMTKDLMVSNKLGMHARPAAMFVKTANRFACDIFVEKDGEKVNGKSIMGLMMLAAGPGSKLTVSALGSDASQALAELEILIKRKFDEE
jgi:phosphocarrier protein HPr